MGEKSGLRWLMVAFLLGIVASSWFGGGSSPLPAPPPLLPPQVDVHSRWPIAAGLARLAKTALRIAIFADPPPPPPQAEELAKATLPRDAAADGFGECDNCRGW